MNSPNIARCTILAGLAGALLLALLALLALIVVLVIALWRPSQSSSGNGDKVTDTQCVKACQPKQSPKTIRIIEETGKWLSGTRYSS